MLGNFSYHNPTKLYFGEESLGFLKDEMKKYGENILLVYGGGSIKKSGLYDEIIAILKDCGKNVAEVAGVMPNPTPEYKNKGLKAVLPGSFAMAKPAARAKLLHSPSIKLR